MQSKARATKTITVKTTGYKDTYSQNNWLQRQSKALAIKTLPVKTTGYKDTYSQKHWLQRHLQSEPLATKTLTAHGVKRACPQRLEGRQLWGGQSGLPFQPLSVGVVTVRGDHRIWQHAPVVEQGIRVRLSC